MNNFTIVQTYEDDEFLLSVLPSKWTIKNGWTGNKNPAEGQDLCFWPKNIAGYRLLEKSKKNPDISVDEHNLRPYRCKIKRTGFQAYAEASRQLKAMETSSDTDAFELSRLSSSGKATAADLFKAIQSQDRSPQSSLLKPLVPERIPKDPEPLPSPQNDQMDTLITMVKDLQTNMNTVMTTHSDLQDDLKNTNNLICRMNSKLDYLAKCSRPGPASQVDVQLKESSISPVNSLEELQALDDNCRNENFVKNAVKTVGRIMGKNRYIGNGATVCLRVVDTLFSREFLTKCSWSGLSRSKDDGGSIIPKIGFGKYERVINLFYQIVAFSDPQYSVDDCNKFLHRCLQNSKQRYEEVKNIRVTSSRKRRKRDAVPHKTLEVVDGSEEANEEEEEQNQEQEEQEEQGLDQDQDQEQDQDQDQEQDQEQCMNESVSPDNVKAEPFTEDEEILAEYLL